MAQINTTVGDFSGNRQKIKSYIDQAVSRNMDLVVFPELTLCGYPPKDLLYNYDFISRNKTALKQLAQQAPDNIISIVGYIEKSGERLLNGAAIIQEGQIKASRYKTLLPNYDVFDEKRFFTQTEKNRPVTLQVNKISFSLGVTICEDLWNTSGQIDVAENLINRDADLIINLSASPFDTDKPHIRQELLRHKVRQHARPLVLVNAIGGQDELIFDGNSLAMDSKGRFIAHGKAFQESLTTFKLDLSNGQADPITVPEQDRTESMYQALVLGVRDYFRKTGHGKAILGLSGGIDSSLVACIAADALGPQYVTCVALPSQFTSEISNQDAATLAHNLEANFQKISIDEHYQHYLNSLTHILTPGQPSITEENVQSRIRGTILMAIANQQNALLLNTGNKTELALGYCTLYGDMCGALAVISDVNKMDVYTLARYVNENAGREIIPQRVFERPPSAELKQDQVDPFNYQVVTPLVDHIVNDNKSRSKLIRMGYDQKLVDDTLARIHRYEFKRAQAAPGLKVTRKAFGSGRRFPIVNKFRG